MGCGGGQKCKWIQKKIIQINRRYIHQWLLNTMVRMWPLAQEVSKWPVLEAWSVYQGRDYSFCGLSLMLFSPLHLLLACVTDWTLLWAIWSDLPRVVFRVLIMLRISKARNRCLTPFCEEVSNLHKSLSIPLSMVMDIVLSVLLGTSHWEASTEMMLSTQYTVM